MNEHLDNSCDIKDIAQNTGIATSLSFPNIKYFVSEAKIVSSILANSLATHASAHSIPFSTTLPCLAYLRAISCANKNHTTPKEISQPHFALSFPGVHSPILNPPDPDPEPDPSPIPVPNPATNPTVFFAGVANPSLPLPTMLPASNSPFF
jgi:hypothetical protein